MKKCPRFKRVLILLAFVAVILGLAYDELETIIMEGEIAMSGVIGVTPQMYGAKADGRRNETKAVQSAIDFAARSKTNKTVFFPVGIYSVRNLNLKEGVILVGEGEKSVLRADPSSRTWDGILNCRGLKSVNISYLTFDGNKPRVPGDDQKGTVNIWVDTCSNVRINHCTFRNNWYLGICLIQSKDITIENNTFLNLDCGVMTSSTPSSNITITGNYFDGAEKSEPISIYALKEGYHENVVIQDNIIKNHTWGSGIGLRAVKGVTVKNNTIYNCGTGIHCSAASYNGIQYGVYQAVIENNTITNSVYEGLLLDDFNSSKLIGNDIENSGTYGIFTNSVKSSVLDSNKLYDVDISKTAYHGFGMSLNGVQSSAVTNNSITVQDNKVYNDRAAIFINSNSQNNTYSSNTVSSNIKNIYYPPGSER